MEGNARKRIRIVVELEREAGAAPVALGGNAAGACSSQAGPLAGRRRVAKPRPAAPRARAHPARDAPSHEVEPLHLVLHAEARAVVPGEGSGHGLGRLLDVHPARPGQVSGALEPGEGRAAAGSVGLQRRGGRRLETGIDHDADARRGPVLRGGDEEILLLLAEARRHLDGRPRRARPHVRMEAENLSIHHPADAQRSRSVLLHPLEEEVISAW